MIVMKAGDLVTIMIPVSHQNAVQLECVGHGVILRFSRTGQSTKSAEVLFTDGDRKWIDCHLLEVISKSEV